MNDLDEILLEIGCLKRRLGDLWDSKGKTDQEVLDLALKIDELLNEYERRLHERWWKEKVLIKMAKYLSLSQWARLRNLSLVFERG